MSIKIALIGNANSGKTTLFNQLTNEYRKVGNWSGVTTDKGEACCKLDPSISIIDLPGLYSLTANSIDESVVITHIKEHMPNVVINVIDGTHLERSLYLTTQLATLRIPTVIALNMYDELSKNGISVNKALLEEKLGMPIVCVSALKKKNLNSLIQIAKAHTSLPNNLPNFLTEEERFTFIEELMKNVLISKQTKSQAVTQKIDSILMNKYLGLPIFFAVMVTVYFLSYQLGKGISGFLEIFFNVGATNIKNYMYSIGMPNWFISLTCSAVIGGVGSVISFLPQILVLFFLLSVLEDSGYMARVAFVCDSLFGFVGLSGKSIIPMVVGCGCTVTGVMATRTIESERERKTAICIVPFIPCGAKTAVFGWFSYTFFNGSPLISASMYFLGMLSAIIVGYLSNKFLKNKDGGFTFEIPTLRTPSMKNVFRVLYEKTKEFLIKAGTVILISSIVIWFLSNFGFNGYVENNSKSFLFYAGNTLKYLFYPLGFGNWQATVSVLSGVIAKESIIETIKMLSANPANLFSSIYSVYAFMAFILLSPPCMASLGVMKKELKSRKTFCKVILLQTIIAYAVALLIRVAFENILPVWLLLLICVGVIITLILIKILRNKRQAIKSGRKNENAV